MQLEGVMGIEAVAEQVGGPRRGQRFQVTRLADISEIDAGGLARFMEQAIDHPPGNPGDTLARIRI